MKSLAGFTRYSLDDAHWLWTGRLPIALRLDQTKFDELWQLHPTEYHIVRMGGRLVNTPRWQQAYGMDYHYTGRVNKALPMLPLLFPLWEWSRQSVDERLNGVLVNWYDGNLAHYIGRHRDSITNMVEGAPIVTISLGEQRVFRLRDPKRTRAVDFQAEDSSVFVMPYETNLAWTHEVPRSRLHRGRRISVTLRAFLASS